ncbi:MAG: alginate lyase family protein, partial [Promethearchaeota archaeon]
KNPPLYGINWYSALEISIRLITWIFALCFFEDSNEINNNSVFKKIFSSMFQHAYYLRYFYTKRKFNHTVGELFGIYLFCRFFNELKPFKKWEKKFYSKFESQIFLQTRVDGVNIEQSINYHREVLEYFSLFYFINSRIKIKKKEKILIEKMYDFLLYIIKPNTSFPLIGDFDDGSILLLNHYIKNPFMQLINFGTILFRREDLKFIVNKIYPSSILLTGIEGWKTFHSLKPKEPIKKLKYFKSSGYISIRNNWNKKANYLFYELARFGPSKASHTHSGITNFIFSFQGKDIILDSGTFTYNKSLKERDYFRSSQAHNLLIINQRNQAKTIPWFGWKNIPHIYRKIEKKNDSIRLVCSHDGYKGFITNRELITNKNLTYLKIIDTIFQKQTEVDKKIYDIDIYYHFNRDLTLKVNENKVIINKILILKISSEQNFIINIEKSFYSPQYGLKYENSMVKIHFKYSFENKKSLEIITEINPLN